MEERELEMDGHDRANFTLVSGIDFNNTISNNDSIILSIWLNGVLWNTRTITYVTDDITKILEFKGLEETEINVVLIIALLMITASIGMLFNSVNAGTYTFLAGGIIIGLISTSFTWVAVVIGLFIILKLMRRVIGE